MENPIHTETGTSVGVPPLATGSAPSREQLQAEFLKHLVEIRNDWLGYSDMTPERKVDGTIFSILVLIDGCALAGGPYPLTALADDRKSEKGIWGDLHDNWHRALWQNKKVTNTGA